MTRKNRIFVPGTYQHIVSRFVDRDFKLGDQRDRDAYLRYADRAQQRWDWITLSYALMSSHPHFGFLAGNMPPERFFRSVHTSFAAYWHRRYGGLGPVFASRPANYEISPGAVARMIIYHHRNPVDAGVARFPEDSRWTSHRQYLRLDRAPAWLDVEQGLAVCGFDDVEADRKRFGEYVRQLVPADYAAAVEPMVQRQSPDGPPGAVACRSGGAQENSVNLDLLAFLAADVCDAHKGDVMRRSRSTHDAKLVFVAAAERLGVYHAVIARHCGVTRASISGLLRSNQDRIILLMPRIRRTLENWRAVEDSEERSIA